MNITMKKYYINMDRSTERKKVMENTYPNLIRVEAYDGSKLNKYNDIEIPTKTSANIYELGCVFSHIKAILTAYKNGDEMALILEDDIYDTYKAKWVKDINEIVSNAPPDAECIILHCINGNEIRSMLNINNDYSRWNAWRWSTGAYIINKKGMNKIYNLCFKNDKILLNASISHTSDYYIYNNLISYNYTKPLFIHQIKDSTIHKSHIMVCHSKAYQEIIKYFGSLKK